MRITSEVRGLMLPLLLGPYALFAQAPTWKVDLQPPAGSEPLAAKATVPEGTAWVVVFYRRAGETEFESFTLEAGPDGTFSGRMESLLPPGTRLEHYAAMRGPSGMAFLPVDAPNHFLRLDLPGDPGPVAQMPPVAPETSIRKSLQKSLNADANFSEVIHRRPEAPGERNFLASGQVRYAAALDEGDRHLKFAARMVYTNQPAANQAPWSVGDIQASFAQGPHLLRAGDLAAQESDFTLGSGGRRGLDYTYSGETRGHLFALNTERQGGLTGLLWPVAGSEVYGGALGHAWGGEQFRARVVLLSGRDDPSTAVNATTTNPLIREGSTGALILDGKLFDNRFAYTGEYARSSYSPDATSTVRETDQAWRVNTLWNQGPLSAHAGYRSVGRDFGTVGVAYFVGDRRVFDSSVGLNYAQWGLTATATDERTNPTGRPELSQSWSQNQGLDLRLSLLSTLSWRTGLRHAHQESGYTSNPMIPFSNSERLGLTTGLDWTLPPRSTLTFNVQIDRLRATGPVETLGRGTTFSLGGCIAPTEWAKLSPSLSWARTISDPGGESTTVSNAFLNAEFAFIPRVLSLLVNGGSSHSSLPTGERLTSSTAEASLFFTLDPYLNGWARGSLGLKGRQVHTPLAGLSLEDRRALLILNLSF